MKAINESQVPKFVQNLRPSKYDFVSETLKAGKVCVIEANEYNSEISIRSAIRAHLERRGMKASVRKDPQTGDLYVFLKK